MKLPLAFCALALSSFALETQWRVNSPNNFFQTNDNWTQGVPGVNDVGIFNTSGTTVFINAEPSPSVYELRFLQPTTVVNNGQVTLDKLTVSGSTGYFTSAYDAHYLNFFGADRLFTVTDRILFQNTKIFNPSLTTGNGTIDLVGSSIFCGRNENSSTFDGVTVNLDQYIIPNPSISPRKSFLGAPDLSVTADIYTNNATFTTTSATGSQLFNNTYLFGTNTYVHIEAGNVIGPMAFTATETTFSVDGDMYVQGLNGSPYDGYSFLDSGLIEGRGTLTLLGTVDISTPIDIDNLIIGTASDGSLYAEDLEDITSAKASVFFRKGRAINARTFKAIASKVITRGNQMIANIRLQDGSIWQVTDTKINNSNVRVTSSKVIAKRQAPSDTFAMACAASSLEFDRGSAIDVEAVRGLASVQLADVSLKIGLTPSLDERFDLVDDDVVLTVLPSSFSSDDDALGYQIMTFDNTTVEGDFRIVIDPSLGSFTPVVNSQGIYIVSNTNTFETIATTSNNQHVGSLLNQLLFSPTTPECLSSDIQSMLFLSSDADNHIMSQMQPTAFKNQQIVLEEMMFNINDETQENLYSYHQGFKGALYGGFNRLVQHGFSQYGGYRSQAGYEMIAMTYGKNSWQVLGGLGALETSVRNKKINSKSSSASVLGTLAVSYFMKHWAFGLDGLYGYNFLKTTRHVNQFDAKAVSAHGGYSIKTQGHVNYDKTWNNTRLRPYDDLAYLFTYENSFKEHRADCLDFRVRSSSRSMIRNTLGFRLDLGLQYEIKPFIDLSYVYEYRFKGQDYRFKFVDTDSYASTKGLPPPRNMGKVVLGLNRSEGLWDYQLKFTGQYGKRFKDSGVHLNVDRRF